MILPTTKTQVGYVQFGGGIDLETPALSIKSGHVTDSINYEPNVFGGYRALDGIERSDGRPSPSDAIYFRAETTLTGTPAVGNTLTGSTSAATGVVAQIAGTIITLTKVTGTFIAEAFTGGGGGTFTSAPVRSGFTTGYDDAVALNAAADIYRADITTVNGARPIRGIWLYKGIRYAFIDNAGATACEMFKSSATGWTAVPLGRELAFTSGGTYVPAEGDTITGETSGATAVLTRIPLESGSYAAGTAAGRFIFASQTGTFQAETVKVGANLNIANISGNATAITLAKSGRYEFVNYNFTGNTDTLRMYGCDGVNRAFEFDGTIFVPIKTGMTADTPSHIIAHKHALFLSFRGSVQSSGLGLPYSWTPITGAAEIDVGDDVSGFLVQPGATLAIFTRGGSTYQLVGSSSADFVLNILSAETGGIPYTLQNLENKAFALDDRGIIEITRTQAYGNFDSSAVSRKMQRLINTIRSKAVASSVYRTRNQYRIYGNDGTGIVLTTDGTNVVGLMPFDYNSGRTTNLIKITCACSGEDATGNDVVYLGADNGFVYQADKGSSFDGEPIQRYLRMPFNDIKSPNYIKEYFKAALEMSAIGYAVIRFQPEFSYGDSAISGHITLDATIQGAGGYWDSSIWDEFYYDSKTVSSPEFLITGQGTNLSLTFYSNNDIDRGHVLQGMLIHYAVRNISR